jgi:hypothetical protein
MDFDIRGMMGLIVIAGGATVVGLSYVAVYFMGKNAARKELEGRESFQVSRPADRLDRIESAVDSIAVEMERLGEAQRFLLGPRSVDPSAQPNVAKPERRHRTPV